MESRSGSRKQTGAESNRARSHPIGSSRYPFATPSEVGSIAVTLINEKIKRMRKTM
jgi:hypothetical protein